MNHEDRERLARQAEYILASEAFEVAMEALEGATVTRWSEGLIITPADREEAYQFVRAARLFKQQFRAIVEDFKLSKAQAETRAAFLRVQKKHAVG